MQQPREPSDTVTPSEARRPPDRAGYWKANIRLIAVLLCIWAGVSYGCGILLIEPLNRFSIGGVPLGFWFAQQGAMYVFIALIAVYAVGMDRLDRKYGMRRRPADER